MIKSSIGTSQPCSPPDPRPEPPGAQVYSSRDLFQDRNEIRIQHEGEIYRLRITRSGGLLLNK
ncbi:hypothetical protein BH10PSE7_BH10PSE7_24970 [soil metagenome]